MSTIIGLIGSSLLFGYSVQQVVAASAAGTAVGGPVVGLIGSAFVLGQAVFTLLAE